MKKYNKEKKKEPKKKTIPKMRKDFEIIDHDACFLGWEEIHY